MIDYIIKTTLCSAILVLMYLLLLEEQKMHRFNRFYLLCSIVFSFAVPFINLGTTIPEVNQVSEMIQLRNTYEQYSEVKPGTDIAISKPFNWAMVFFTGYFGISLILLFRYVKNMVLIYFIVKKNTSVEYFQGRLVLLRGNLTPHSFLKYIFINKQDFESGAIEKAILQHELTHVQQKHSLDVLFIELVQVIAWWNPFLYLYKKAIKLNHEFLADENVVNKLAEPRAYQLLLLSKATETRSLAFTSQFNYLTIKKRLQMITKHTSLIQVIFRLLAIAPVVVFAVLFFSNKVIAQDTLKPSVQKTTTIEPVSAGVSQKLMDEYEAIINSYKTYEKKWLMQMINTITQTDRDRLEAIFMQMSAEQKSAQTVFFMPNPPPLPRVVPTKKQLEQWKDSKIYGVWINEKRVNNTLLNNYSTSDFGNFFVSKLSKNTVNYGKHYYQVDLMTTAYYNDYLAKEVINKDRMILVYRVQTLLKK